MNLRIAEKTADRGALPPEFFDWLNSAAGQSAVQSAVKNSQSAVKSLDDERQLNPEQLHVPITL